jgi:hypothetical protein
MELRSYDHVAGMVDVAPGTSLFRLHRSQTLREVARTIESRLDHHLPQLVDVASGAVFFWVHLGKAFEEIPRPVELRLDDHLAVPVDVTPSAVAFDQEQRHLWCFGYGTDRSRGTLI